jgi:hypothetical protein
VGTKGSYTGGGGKDGKDLRDAVAQWASTGDAGHPRQPLPVDALLPALRLFRSGSDRPSGGGGGIPARPSIRSGGGGSEGGGGAGATRTVGASARTAGRAAAAAYGLRIGDANLLREFGLDYATLRNINDPLQVTKAIVDAACGPLANSTIEDHEQRLVAGEIATWILEAQVGGHGPTPDEIAREAIALIVFEAACSETVARLQQGDPSATASVEAEAEMLATARVLADNAKLSADGATEREFRRAIEKGIASLRLIFFGEK